ncbi:MAG: hypothetical protein ACJ8DZ_13810 [Allosphingosinicella sp.]
MADNDGAATGAAEKPKRGRAKAGDNPGEPGDKTSAVAGDNDGEITERTDEGAAGGGETELVDGGESPVIVRLAATGEDISIDARSLVFDLRDGILEFLKRLPRPWEQTPFDQQRDVSAAAEQVAKEMVRRAVEAIASDDRTSIRALLVKYDEGDDIKVTLKVKAFSTEESEAAVLGLHRARGKHVLITVASADDYAEDAREPSAVRPDQPDLGFEAGTDQDLADAGDNRRINVQTGYVELREEDGGLWVENGRATLDELRDAGDGLWRVNLESGMVENLPEGNDADDDSAWADIRAAEPAELAAEREARADFTG